MRRAASLLLSLLVPARAGAQTHPTVAEHIVLGDSAHTALAPAQALQHYRAALAADSTNYAALWKAGRELVDIAKQVEGKDDSSKHLRDSLYTAARAYGEAAVRVNPSGAEGHFTVGQALGRLSRTKGGKERVRFAKIIYDEGMKAVELDSTHDGACHLVGAWHAEVLLGVVPVALVEEAAPEERFGEELLEPRQPFDLGMPRADQVTGAVVGRVELDGFHPFIINDLGEAHPLLAPLGAGEATQGLADGEVTVGSVGVHAHGGLAEGARLGVESVPQVLGRIVLARDLLGDVHELAARFPQRLVVERVEGERRAIVGQGLLRRERGVGAVAPGDVLRHRGPPLAGQQRGTGEAPEPEGPGTTHQRLRTGAGRECWWSRS